MQSIFVWREAARSSTSIALPLGLILPSSIPFLNFLYSTFFHRHKQIWLKEIAIQHIFFLWDNENFANATEWNKKIWVLVQLEERENKKAGKS
ncbi:MAG: hypothetical protein C5B59_20910 [Bacteroidetes bacterium]|nr:MAG: hypothetical protein C5B59_20910 [Bacteroidota bacterium]